MATPYVVEEVLRNLPEFPVTRSGMWVQLRQAVLVLDDVMTLDEDRSGRSCSFFFFRNIKMITSHLINAQGLSF